MAELERDLRGLAPYVELPAERDLWPAVEARLGARPRRTWLRLGMAVAVAVALAVGIAFAVPPARSAILRFFGLEGVSIVRVDRLPSVPANPVVYGTRTTLAAAGRDLGFRPRLPDVGSAPRMYVDPSHQAFLAVYGRPARLRLEETRAGVFQKMVSTTQPVNRVEVNGDPGIWLEGDHVFSDFFGQPRLSGNALLWEHDGVTYRLEGRLTRQQALQIASSVGSG
jgi:hypothetical protein